MKKLFMLTVFTALLFFCGCEEEFSPKTDFKEKYVLYGIVRSNPLFSDASIEVVVLRTYDIDGFDPSANHLNKAIGGCQVTLTIGDKEVPLKSDTLKKVTDSFKPVYSYTRYGLAIQKNNELKLKAVLPDGKVLSARTKVPEILSLLEFSFPFRSGVHSKLNRFIWGDKWIINWDAFEDYLYFPKLTLNYEVLKDSRTEHKSIDIPLSYTQKNGKSEPVYPSYTWDQQIEYSYDCIDSVMYKISEGDTAKSSYIIRSVTFTIMEYETNLASYFSSTNGYLDNFSIRLDESVYTNVIGGIGVFGGYTPNIQVFKVERTYTESFGYKWREP